MMTRYMKAKIDYLVSTANVDPEGRFRALKKMGNCFGTKELDEYLMFRSRFETENDIEPEEATEMLVAMKKH